MPAPEPLRIRFDAFELDEDDARVLRCGQPVPLTPKAFAVLCALARHPGRLVTKDELLDAVWGHRHISDSVLKTTISSLRSALADDPRQPRFIETASRRGYRFIASECPVQAAPSSSPSPSPSLSPAPSAPPQQRAIVGRQRELEELNRAWAEARSGRRKFVWVCGDAGVGKTTLVDTFTHALSGEQVAFGQCIDQFGSGEPYLPVLDALASLCRSDPALPALLRDFAPAWLIQLPWLCDEAERQQLRGHLSQVSADRMLRELGELLDEYARHKSLLIVLEDLHWSDPATVRLLDYLARRRNAAKLMLMGTFRLAELAISSHPMRDLRHELRLQRLCDELVLDSFSESEVGDFLAARAHGSPLPEQVTRAVHARTEGLPLFVDTLAQDLQAQGLLESPDLEEARIAWEIPESLAAIVEKRLERLPAGSQELLEAASVCGSEFALRVLANVVGREIEDVDDACEQLAVREYWLRHVAVESDRTGALDAKYAFRHALYRDVLYKRCAALRRASLHRRVGEALERFPCASGTSTVELASHFELGQQPSRAIPHYLAAIDSAIARFAPCEAVALGARAMELLPQLPRDASRGLTLATALKHALACAQCFGMSSDEAGAAYARVQELCDDIPIESPELAWTLNGIALMRFGRGEYEEARSLGDRIHSYAAQGEAGLRLAACNIHAWVAAMQGRHDDSIRWAEQGLRVCEAAGDTLDTRRFFVDPVVMLEGVLVVELAQQGAFNRSMLHAQRAQARAQAIARPMAQALTQRCMAFLDMRLHEPERVLERARFLMDYGDRYGGAQPAALGRLFAGWAEAQLGDPHTGSARIRDGIQRLHDMVLIGGVAQARGWLAEALFLGGDAAAARAQLTEAIATAERQGEAAFLPELLRIEAQMERHQGNEDRARALLLRSFEQAVSQNAGSHALDAAVALCESAGATAADAARLNALLASLDENATGPWFDQARRLAASFANTNSVPAQT